MATASVVSVKWLPPQLLPLGLFRPGQQQTGRFGAFRAETGQSGKDPIADIVQDRHALKMAALHKVTFDPNSGRPIAPIWWRVTPFFITCAWLMAALLLLLAYDAARHVEWSIAGLSIAAGTIIVLFAHWEKRRIDHKRQHFEQQVSAYERGISAQL